MDSFETEYENSNEERTPVSILELATYRLKRKAETGKDFEEAGLAIIGGCYNCHASIAAYNAYPSRNGYWKCKDCIGDTGWYSLKNCNFDLFEREEE